jgi:uncharacterized membrane protein
MKSQMKSQITERYNVLDLIRGFALINMVLYHGIWDLVFMRGVRWAWFHSDGAFLWQQGICWTFILVSGFCFNLAKRPYKGGAKILLCGVTVSLVTQFLPPQSRIHFGVLTLIGVSMLLTYCMRPVLQKCNAVVGLICSFLLFLLTRDVRRGFIGFFGLELLELPKALYKNLFTTFWGFPYRGFSSADYFPLLPWFFLFLTGYFLYRVCEKKGCKKYLKKSICKPIEWLGQHSLLIYMCHQPILYLILCVGRV